MPLEKIRLKSKGATSQRPPVGSNEYGMKISPCGEYYYGREVYEIRETTVFRRKAALRPPKKKAEDIPTVAATPESRGKGSQLLATNSAAARNFRDVDPADNFCWIDHTDVSECHRRHRSPGSDPNSDFRSADRMVLSKLGHSHFQIRTTRTAQRRLALKQIARRRAFSPERNYKIPDKGEEAVSVPRSTA